MKKEATCFSNVWLLVDDNDYPNAVQMDDETIWAFDRVRVTADAHGYICPGIKTPGEGIIMEIRRDDTDHFFGVLMNSGEFGFMKKARIEVIEEDY